MKLPSWKITQYSVALSTLCLVLLLFTKIIPTQPAKADDGGYDLYPWINTFLYNNMKNPMSYTTNDGLFIADHFDALSSQVWHVMSDLKSRNPGSDVFMFVGVGYLSAWQNSTLDEYFELHPEYSYSQRESVVIHYKCDVIQNSVTIPGCNITNSETGECSGQPAAGCVASTATNLSQSRVPDPDPSYQSRGWLMPNYTSATYEDYAVWDITRVLNLYQDEYLVDGIFWDNILYLGSAHIDKTIEYWGYPDTGLDHPRNDDYHTFFDTVKQDIEQSQGRSLFWMGNVNNMYWIRPGTPHLVWVLANLLYATPESWVSPLGFGEYHTPSWLVDCSDVQEAWDITANHGVMLPVMTYNAPFEGSYDDPDQRTKTFSLAKYYLVNNSKLYYGYTEDHLAVNLSASNWNRMAEVNIGNPRQNEPGVRDFEGQFNTSKFFDWNNPGTQLSCTYFDWDNLVMARHYDNGLVLTRWKGQRWGSGTPPANDPAYNSYIDPQEYSLSNSYHNQYYIVEPDGTLSEQPVSSITLRTNEAAVLLQVCPFGTVTATCGCYGVVRNPGESCLENAYPLLDSIENQIMNEVETLSIPLHATDADCPAGDCLHYMTSSTGIETGSFITLVDNNDGTGTLTCKPGYTDSGSYLVSVSVQDNGDPPLDDETSFSLSVSETNRPPILQSIGNKTVHERDVLNVTVIATDEDVGDTLTFTAEPLSSGALFTDHGDRTATFAWTPSDQQSGEYPVTVTVSDGTDTDTEDITITVLDGASNCDPDWQCTNWSACTSGLQTRTCTDVNRCGTDAGRPSETAVCDSVAPGRVTDLISS